jgi:hypothetical protein
MGNHNRSGIQEDSCGWLRFVPVDWRPFSYNFVDASTVFGMAGMDSRGSRGPRPLGGSRDRDRWMVAQECPSMASFLRCGSGFHPPLCCGDLRVPLPCDVDRVVAYVTPR